MSITGSPASYWGDRYFREERPPRSSARCDGDVTDVFLLTRERELQSPIGSRWACDQEEQMTEAYRHDEIAELAYEL